MRLLRLLGCLIGAWLSAAVKIHGPTCVLLTAAACWLPVLLQQHPTWEDTPRPCCSSPSLSTLT
jgi:hypothetical protein